MSGVIYNDGGKVKRPCPVHDRRPIHPSLLWLRLWVREELQRRHASHYMYEPGCPLCALGAAPDPP